MANSPRLPLQDKPKTYLSVLLSQPLTGSDLHIWCASLTSTPQELLYWYSILSPDERARAERYYFERDRKRFACGRGILRILLSRYLEIEASRITIKYGPHGKPVVQEKFQNRTIQFNLAHSNDCAIYVFAWDRPVGIDIERIRPMQDADDIAKRFFSTRESMLINSLAGDEKWRAFFRIWTYKEAFLKANGSGLSAALDRPEISLDVNSSANFNYIGGDLERFNKWRLETFNPIVGYQAAIACEGHGGRMIFQRYASIDQLLYRVEATD